MKQDHPQCGVIFPDPNGTKEGQRKRKTKEHVKMRLGEIKVGERWKRQDNRELDGDN